MSESRLKLILFPGLVLAALCGQTAVSVSAEPASRTEIAPAFDTHNRQLWTTGQIQGSPEPPDPFTTERVFPAIQLHEPLAVDRMPGISRIGVATRPGKIYTFEIRDDVQEAELMLDIGRTTYGFAFHPKFSENGYIYVTTVRDPVATEDNGSRISRFTVTAAPSLNASAGEARLTYTADLSSEVTILEWPSGGHNGGCLRFGPDGYLYLATGDGSGIADGFETGQAIDDLLGAILRIDVDHSGQGLPYSIPADNPFAATPGARGEIWSFGHRQVWKFSFDDQRRMWAGEVGQDLWEMIYLIERGGNYGWSVREGTHPFRPERKHGPGAFVAPLVEHSHNDFRSITGGNVWRSERIPELAGSYVYGDYDTGKLWTLKYADGKVSSHRQLADTQHRIVEFAQDDRGEVYVVDFVGGGFHRIVPAPPQPSARPFPRRLNETGLFRSTRDYIPAAGLVPYSVNAPLWSDGAEKDRWIALPGDSRIQPDAVVYPHGPEYPDPGWRFPDGTVLVKTFSIAMDTSHPEQLRRLETRILHYRQMPGNDDEYGAQLWNGYTYVWNQEQTDADLLDAGGLDQTFRIRDSTAPGGMREQTWHFPSRAECALCHTMAAKYVLGITTLQMNRQHNYGDTVENQLTVMQRLGLFSAALPKPVNQLPELVDYNDETAPIHLRARAYLHANCAHCHRKWGGGNAEFELQASSPLSQTLTVNARPGHGTFGVQDPRILVPGDASRSLIVARMQLDGLGKMPHIGSNLKDQESIGMLQHWVNGLDSEEQTEQPGVIRPRTAPPIPLK